MLIGCGFTTAQPGRSGECSIHEAANTGIPVSLARIGIQGALVEPCDTLLGNMAGLLPATTNILEYIREDFWVLVLCLCEIECMNRVTERL